MENPSLAKHVHVCILILKLRTLITNLPTGIFTHQCSALSLYPSNGVTYQYLSPFNEAPLPSNDVLQICVVYPFRKKETCPPIKYPCLPLEYPPMEYPYTPLGYPDLPKEGVSLPSKEPLLSKGIPFIPIWVPWPIKGVPLPFNAEPLLSLKIL